MRVENARKVRSVFGSFITGLVALGFLLPLCPAFAAEFQSGGFVGGGIGSVREESEIPVDKSKNNYARKLFFGYQLLDYLGVEGGFVNFDGLKHNLGGNVTDEIEIKAYYARAYGQIPLSRNNNRMVAIYAAGGASRWDLTEEVRFDQTLIARGRIHDVSPIYGAGVVLRTRDSAFRLEYEMYKDIGEVNKLDLRVIQLSFLFFL